MNQGRTLSVRGLVVSLLVVVFVVWLFVWLYNSSFISVSLGGTSQSPAQYKLINQESGKETIVSATNFKKRVSRGSYQLSASRDETSSFRTVITKGFFRTTSINIKLQPEKDRKFIGNNPQDCTGLLNGILVSYACGGLFSDARIHVPATADTPTYIDQNSQAAVSGYLQGIVQISEGSAALIRLSGDYNKATTNEDKTNSGLYYLYLVDEKLTPFKSIHLTDLSPEKVYSIKKAGTGFLIYDTTLTDAYYYNNYQAKPRKIEFGAPSIDGLKRSAFDIKDLKTLMLYSESPGSKKSIEKTKTEIVVSGNDVKKNISISGYYQSALFCGNNKICLLSDGVLRIYDLESNKLISTLKNIEAIDNSIGFIAVDKDGVLSFDVDKQIGYYLYTFSDFGYESMESTINGYILNIGSGKASKSALFIDLNSENVNSIDKKIFQLEKIPEIKSISIYDKFISIVPEYGNLEYDAKLRSFEPNKEILKKAAETINKKIDELKIDRTKFVFSNFSQ